jgi:hypothetical protein
VFDFGRRRRWDFVWRLPLPFVLRRWHDC